jgi:glycosyltransferase 2 family protein
MSRLARALLLIAGAFLLTALVVRVGPVVIAGLMRRVGFSLVLVAGVYAAHVCVRAVALWRCLPVGTLPFRDVLRIRFAGEAVEMLTFTGPFLAEPTKGYLLSRSGAGVAEGFGAVAIEYLLYTLSATWIAAVALALLLTRHSLPDAMARGVAVVLAILVAFTLGFVTAAITGRGLLVASLHGAAAIIGRDRVNRLVARVEPVERVILTFIHNRAGRMSQVLIIECAGHGLLALEVAIVMSALGLAYAWRDPLVVEGGVKFISVAFFFVPGQLGAQESVYTLLFQALGFPPAAGLTMALVRRVRALAVAGLGTVALSLTS